MPTNNSPLQSVNNIMVATIEIHTIEAKHGDKVCLIKAKKPHYLAIESKMGPNDWLPIGEVYPQIERASSYLEWDHEKFSKNKLMAKANPNKWFTTSRGQRLDILFSEPPGDPKALLVIFPCTGGTSRAYSVPYEVLADRGFAVVEYHSPICGRSHGHTETRLALRDFYEYLFRRKLIHLPMILFGHSGGANAMLQLKELFLRIQYAFFVNPVLCYREYAAHMYAVGGQPQLIEALMKHTTSLPELTEMLMKDDWLDPQLWHDNELRAYLDSISEGATGEGLLIGTLLEDLYMPGHSVASELGKFRGRCTVVTSAQDVWCPVSRTAEYAALYGVDHEVLASAPDHFMHGAWPDIWEIFERVTSHVNKGR